MFSIDVRVMNRSNGKDEGTDRPRGNNWRLDALGAAVAKRVPPPRPP